MAASGIPVIDISNPSPQTAKQVLEAASTHGFLFIANDGVTVPPTDIDTMFDLSKQFFSSPHGNKSSFAIHSDAAGGINRGWVRMQGEALDPSGTKHGDPKEAFNIAPPRPDSGLQPLPDPLAANAKVIARFQVQCHTLCTNILSLLGTALKIEEEEEEEYFATRHDQSKGHSGTIFRMLYYPKTSDSTSTPASQGSSETCIRAGAHSDYGSLTLLFRLPGQAGLELLTSSPSQPQTWTPVPVNPSPSTYPHPPILVNIGDLLCYWTNGMLKSTVHRVTFSGGEERYSMAYFCHPLDEVELSSVPSGIITGFGDRGREELGSQRKRLGLGLDGGLEDDGKVITAKEHLERRLKVTYGI